MSDLQTQPITTSEIQLWQESTPADHNRWDVETIEECDEYLYTSMERIRAVTSIRENYARLINQEPGLIGADSVLDMIDAALK